jgi:hypothetical protein
LPLAGVLLYYLGRVDPGPGAGPGLAVAARGLLACPLRT